MKWRNQSIRFRLTVWYSTVLLAGQLVSGLMIWFLFSYSLHADLEGSLAKRVRGLERYLAIEAAENPNNLPNEMEEFARSLPADNVMQVRGPNDRVIAVSGISESEISGLLPPISQQEMFGNLRFHNTPYRWFRELIQNNTGVYSVVIGAPLQPTNDTLHHLALLLFAVLPGVVLIAALGGLWISRRALAPVGAMNSAASAISFDNLSARLDVPKTSDELQQLAETWNAMLQRIESTAVRITRFTADASHELRTPLSLIRGTIDLALRRPRTAEAYLEALRVIQVEGERMTRLVEDLLFLARTDAEIAHRNNMLFDLRVPIQAAMSELIHSAASKNVRFQTEELNEAVLLLGDEDAMRRLILVLLDNATKYSPAGEDVEITLRVQGNCAFFAVHDKGAGIPAAAKPHIFERFYRADSSRHTSVPSYGLGLAIAKAVAVQHGVEVGFESEPGSTTFSINFPLFLEQAAPTPHDIRRRAPIT